MGGRAEGRYRGHDLIDRARMNISRDQQVRLETGWAALSDGFVSGGLNTI